MNDDMRITISVDIGTYYNLDNEGLGYDCDISDTKLDSWREAIARYEQAQKEMKAVHDSKMEIERLKFKLNT